MKRFLMLWVFLLAFIGGHAQLIKLEAENISIEEQIFNPEFIRIQRIIKATIEFSKKAEGERIQNLLKRWTYSFDKDGRVSAVIKVDHPNYEHPDSSFINYYYNKDGSLKIRRTRYNTSYQGEYFDYDSLGRLVKYVVTKENSSIPQGETFKPAQQQIQFLETYSYEWLSDKQEKVRVYNDNGTLFKEGIIYREKGTVVEKSLRYTITGIRINEKFTYDSRARMTEHIYFTDAVGDLEEKQILTYDENNLNLKVMDYFRNGEHTNQVFYFYNKRNVLLEGEVNKELKTGLLLLRNYKFSYEEDLQNPSPR
jgi:hypothetical protein